MKKDLYLFEKVIYKGKINFDFYIYCLTQKNSIIKYILGILLFTILKFLNIINETIYYNHFFKFLREFKNHKEIVTGFWNKYDKKISSHFLFQKNYQKSLIWCETLDLIVDPMMKKMGISDYICTIWDKRKNYIKGNYNGIIELEKLKQYEIKNAYIYKECNIPVFSICDNGYMVKKDKINSFKVWNLKHRIIKNSITIAFITLFSLFLTFITFGFSLKVFDIAETMKYFKQFDVFILNYLPILFLLTILYFIFNRLWASFGLTSIFVVIVSFINKQKLIFRDEPFLFGDLTLASESLEMAQKYPIVITSNFILLILALLLIVLFLYLKHKSKLKIKTRMVGIILLFVFAFAGYNKIYTSQSVYEKVGDKSNINIWSNTQQFQVRGFIYPFIYSSTESGTTKPNDYSKKNVEKQLETMISYDIPENKKVNIISIMLEAYNDFSKFGIDFNVDVYKNFHEIENEAYSGKIISNVFGGGTINTERSFLTGYNNLSDWKTNTNSFVWYLKNQNYYTEAMHPMYGWFYNRRNIDGYIGFDNFDYYENKYGQIQENFMSDQTFFQYIIEGYEKNKESDKNYFNFSVTYQNHGPYSEEVGTDIGYIDQNSNMDTKTYNRLNNYFKGIYTTDLALKELVDYFRNEEEPVVIVLFGDHNPSLGETDQGYKALDIDISSQETEAFLNKYEIPYLFWANDSAKEITSRKFGEKGSTISPMFLMPELFNYLGWDGNEYMQNLNNLKSNINVINNYVFKEEETYIASPTDSSLNLINDFNNFQYYFITNFKKQTKSN